MAVRDCLQEAAGVAAVEFAGEGGDQLYFAESDQVTLAGDLSMNVALQKAMAALPVDQRACVALCLAGG